jgi:hypothetical protein
VEQSNKFAELTIRRGLDSMKYKAENSVDMSISYPTKQEQASKEDYEQKSKQHTVDFLTAVRKHVLKDLEASYSMRSSRIGIDWMITVPAIWSSDAKNATKECAIAAGMGSEHKLLMTTEPEAAANHSLDLLRPYLSVGEEIMILDAGGGTVDLITYLVTQLEPFQVEESGVCTGGKCGAVFINRFVGLSSHLAASAHLCRAFERLVTDKLAKLKVTPTDTIRRNVVNEFERRVRQGRYLSRQLLIYGPGQEGFCWVR